MSPALLKFAAFLGTVEKTADDYYLCQDILCKLADSEQPLSGDAIEDQLSSGDVNSEKSLAPSDSAKKENLEGKMLSGLFTELEENSQSDPEKKTASCWDVLRRHHAGNNSR